MLKSNSSYEKIIKNMKLQQKSAAATAHIKNVLKQSRLYAKYPQLYILIVSRF